MQWNSQSWDARMELHLDCRKLLMNKVIPIKDNLPVDDSMSPYGIKDSPCNASYSNATFHPDPDLPRYSFDLP